jgi:hypothetical protein
MEEYNALLGIKKKNKNENIIKKPKKDIFNNIKFKNKKLIIIQTKKLKNVIQPIEEQYKDSKNIILNGDEEHIKNVDIDYTIEKGTKNNQLHIHIMLKFRHKTKIQLNYQKIKTKITTDLGLNNIYLNNRLIRNSGSENILDYLNKYTNIN